MRLILASASPRRAQLLAQIGVAHEVMHAQLPEQRKPGESIAECVQRLAESKARVVLERVSARGSTVPAEAGQGSWVLGADTAVAIDGQMLGKPGDEREGLGMLERLSGRVHEVYSAVALVDAAGVRSALSVSQVRLRPITAAEARRYWASGEPRDKAGAYAIQGLGAVFVQTLQGSYSGVMGLPLFETAQLLEQAGVPLWGA
ncbi:MAG TPA: nucleoside triphosphate pyrophosphatase [Steroidobacteraceae bacterium]